MEKTIWKYALGSTYGASGKVKIEMPKGSVVLSVVNQDNIPTVYALVDDTSKKTEVHIFDICLTGGLVSHKGFKFLGTVLLQEGGHVYHVFHKKDRKKAW